MGGAILVFVSQALVVATPPVSASVVPGARISALATVEILRAETTRDDGGKHALKRHRRADADGRVTIEFE